MLKNVQKKHGSRQSDCFMNVQKINISVLTSFFFSRFTNKLWWFLLFSLGCQTPPPSTHPSPPPPSPSWRLRPPGPCYACWSAVLWTSSLPAINMGELQRSAVQTQFTDTRRASARAEWSVGACQRVLVLQTVWMGLHLHAWCCWCDFRHSVTVVSISARLLHATIMSTLSAGHEGHWFLHAAGGERLVSCITASNSEEPVTTISCCSLCSVSFEHLRIHSSNTSKPLCFACACKITKGDVRTVYIDW